MGGATRFMSLFSTPFPALHPSIPHRLSTAPLRRPITDSSSSSKLKLTQSPLQVVSCFHTQSNKDANTSHPWPELTNFLNFILSDDTCILPEHDDAFVVYERLPDDFLRASASCLSFARARPEFIRSLSRKDIGALVSTGTPFLFRCAIDIARRMRAFLASHASEVEKASTVDPMKYILSYASNTTISSKGNGLYNRDLVDSSIHNLLCELVTVSSGAPGGYVPATDNQFSGRPRQTAGPLGQSIEMKRGNWICTKYDCPQNHVLTSSRLHISKFRAYAGGNTDSGNFLDGEEDDKESDIVEAIEQDAFDSSLESQGQDDGIEIQIEKTGKNSRRIRSKVVVQASLQSVWEILTHYEKLADYIPSLAVSQLLEKRDKFARLLQIGQQDLAFGLKFSAKGVIDCFEKDLLTLPLSQKRDIEFKMIEGDFQVFEGIWSMEQAMDNNGGNIQRDSTGRRETQTTLLYVVEVKPKLWLPVRLVEGRLCKEIKTNLSSIREEAEKAFRNAHSSL